MPYPGVDGFFDAEGRGLEQSCAPQCAKSAEIIRFLVRGEVFYQISKAKQRIAAVLGAAY